MSLAKAISIELTGRLAAIRLTGGTLTDAGARVFRGKRRLDDTNIPCCVIVEGEDSVADQGGKSVKLRQRYIVEAHDHCDPDHPNDKAHDLLVDLKRAVFTGDKTMGRKILSIEYVGRTIGAREDGVGITFAALLFDVVYAENLTEP